MSSFKNLSKVINNIKKFGKEAVEMVDLEMNANVNDIVLDAKKRVYASSGNNDSKARATDLGKLAQGIYGNKQRPLSYIIVAGGSAVKYAPYIEFGTGNRVSLSYLKEIGLPDSYAMKFKGAGIREVNITAKPYFFPAIIKGRKDLEKRLNQELKRLTKKANG